MSVKVFVEESLPQQKRLQIEGTVRSILEGRGARAEVSLAAVVLLPGRGQRLSVFLSPVHDPTLAAEIETAIAKL